MNGTIKDCHFFKEGNWVTLQHSMVVLFKQMAFCVFTISLFLECEDKSKITPIQPILNNATKTKQLKHWLWHLSE